MVNNKKQLATKHAKKKATAEKLRAANAKQDKKKSITKEEEAKAAAIAKEEAAKMDRLAKG